MRLRYARNLCIVRFPDYTLAVLRNPWDTAKTLRTYALVDRHLPLPNLPEGAEAVRVPLERCMVYSSVHCSLFKELGALDRIAGICGLEYMNMPEIRLRCAEGRVADCGNSLSPDVEKIIDLHPDAILLSPFENSNGYGKIGKLGIPLVECADYMETSPLGRAEWMAFYGLLTGTCSRADSLFREVEAAYLRLKKLALQAESRPAVMSDLKYGATWYVSGGGSTTGKLFADAGNGSPAPWDPVGKLIITGPYAYMRNPMLTGVFLILLGEALLFQSRALGWYWLIFVMINAFYFPLSEEKGLLKRFGKEYETYKNNVPRFIPRLSPYKKK